MGLWDKLKGELIDIIEWLDDSRDTMVFRFPRYDNEIKMGAQLVVRESQTAVFVNQGKIADVFKPGTWKLETANLPVLSTLQGWKYGFHSPFKAEVYFVNTRLFTDLKWGTQNPVIARDSEFGMVRLRAFGTYAVRVIEPAAFLRELVGTDPLFKTEEVTEWLRQLVVGRLAGALAAAQVPVLDLAAHQDRIGAALGAKLSEEVRPLGLEIARFVVENVSLPPEVEQALDKRTQMGVLGNLDRYTQLQSANAIEQAAKNPGGGAGEALGIGAGIGLGQRMAQSMGAGAVAGTPPPLPAEQWFLGVAGKQVGPLDAAGLRAEAAAGRLTPDTLVWRSGMAAWAAARGIPEVAALLPPAPPPLPR
jgi:membrane protease subunit (stomatin/prohibitin family)